MILTTKGTLQGLFMATCEQCINSDTMLFFSYSDFSYLFSECVFKKSQFSHAAPQDHVLIFLKYYLRTDYLFLIFYLKLNVFCQVAF